MNISDGVPSLNNMRAIHYLCHLSVWCECKESEDWYSFVWSVTWSGLRWQEMWDSDQSSHELIIVNCHSLPSLQPGKLLMLSMKWILFWWPSEALCVVEKFCQDMVNEAWEYWLCAGVSGQCHPCHHANDHIIRQLKTSWAIANIIVRYWSITKLLCYLTP